jgi:phosphodiesterase/alkaline phosphatase D-like protein
MGLATEQIHLSLGEDATEMIITWVTQTKPKFRSTVAYGREGDEGMEEKTGYWTKFKSGYAHWIYVHRVLLQGLLPGTRYQYTIKDENHWSKKHSFKTFDFEETGREPRIAIFGDMGTHNSRAVPKLKRHTERGELDIVFHIGDLAYDLWDDDGRMADNFMKLIEPIASKIPYQVCKSFCNNLVSSPLHN